MQVVKVAIAIGDPAGIGPEGALKAARHPEVLALGQPVLVGSREALAMHAAPCGIALDDLYIRDVPHARPQFGKVAPGHGRAALDAAAVAGGDRARGKVVALGAARDGEAATRAC